MNAKFISNDLEYVLITDKLSSICDRSGDIHSVITGAQIKTYATDDLFIYIVFDPANSPYDDKVVYYFPLSKQPTAKLMKKCEFNAPVNGIYVNKSFMFISHGSNISIFESDFDELSTPLSTISTKNTVTTLSADNTYFIYADGLDVCIYRLCGMTFYKRFTFTDDVKHPITHIVIRNNLCFVVTSKATLVHVFSLTNQEAQLPIRLGYLNRNIRAVTASDTHLAVVSGKTLHLISLETRKDRRIELSGIDALASVIVKNNIYILDEKKVIHEFPVDGSE